MKKRIICIILSFVMLLSLVPMAVLAQDKDEPYAVLDGTTLTFYYDRNRSTRDGVVYDVPENAKPSDEIPWKHDLVNFVTVESVVFDSSFKNFSDLQSTYGWFHTTSDTVLKSVSGMGNINTSNLTDISLMFSSLKEIETIDFGDFTASGLLDINKLFYGCKKLASIDVSGLDTSSVTDMNAMFSGCESLTALDVSKFDTSNVTNMNSMFTSCASLSKLDVTNFITTNVTNMNMMFAGCKSLEAINVSGFDTSKVTNMTYMFGACSKLTKLDLSSFSTAAQPAITQMFNGCSSLSSIYVSEKWDNTKCTGSNAFASCSENLIGGLGTTWNSNNKGNEFAQIDGGESNPGYFSPVVTVKANDAEKKCGEDDTLTATVTGLYPDSTVKYTLSREEGETAGTYTVTPAGDAYQGVYKVVYQTGTLTILHKTAAVSGKEPKIGEAGYLSCYRCDGCGTYFADENANEVIGDANAYAVWIAEGGNGYLAPLQHDFQPINGKDATDAEAGYKLYYACCAEGECHYAEDEAGLSEIPDIEAWKAEGGNGYLPALHGTDENPKDHKCDYCGEELSEHVDADPADHICDECGSVVSECKDEDRDHKCDVCGKVLSEFVDENNDHKCDICGKAISGCDDKNNDHKCDVCGKVLTECADIDGDHKCDLCGEVLTECVDNDNDHKCDVCGKVLTECADIDGDHKCDLCDKVLTECADNNKDHLCDLCGKEISAHVCVLCEGTAATLQHAGFKSYYRCECGKYFEDAACETEITDLEKWKSEGGSGYLPKLENPDIPTTDDTSNVGLWIVMLVLSVVVLLSCDSLCKKRKLMR